MYFIMESLLIGNVYDAQQPPPFISAVLWTALEERISSPAGVHFARIPLREYTEPDPIDLEAGVDWLTRHHKENRVLVACRAGLGRSASLVIAYLCCVKNMSYQEAVQFVQARRPGATPLPNLEKTIEKLKALRRGESVGSTSTEIQEQSRS